MKYESKAFPFEIKQVSEAGEVEGYASVFGGIDSYGDTVVPGAFSRSIAMRKPKMLADHDMRARAGVWDIVREDEKGLYVKGRLNMEKQMVRELYSDMKMGALDGLSIGYRTLQDEMDGKVRKLKEVDLMEVSFVTIGADQNAKVLAVKSDSTIRDWEAFLRDAGGLSRQEAKAFCAGGFKALAALRDEADEGEDAGAALLNLLKTFGR